MGHHRHYRKDSQNVSPPRADVLYAGEGETLRLSHTVCEGVAHRVSHLDSHCTQRLGGRSLQLGEDLVRVSE